MMPQSTRGIPPSMPSNLRMAPEESPVALLLRHSARSDLPSGVPGCDTPITEAGAGMARELGILMGDRLKTLHASPVLRCVQTAEALREGCFADLPIIQDSLLGAPGAYVHDEGQAGDYWMRYGHEHVMHRLACGSDALPGMARPGDAARRLVNHMLRIAGNIGGLHVFVTHDSLVAPTAAHMARRPLGKGYWPDFLEGVFFWMAKGAVNLLYRDILAVTPEPMGGTQGKPMVYTHRGS